jgi:nitrogen fixation NifU-like protein
VTEMYTERLLDHYRHPRNKRRLASPDPTSTDVAPVSGQVISAQEYNPLCGDRVTIEARVERGQIVEACFEGRGCALCLGAASILTETIEGRSLEELEALGKDEFLTELESPIRPARLKCALLPWMAFRKAAYGQEEWPD